MIVEKEGVRRYRELLTCLLLAAVVLVLYREAGGFGFIDFDDNSYVFENRHLRSGLSLAGILWAFGTTEAANWHPLTWLSLLADYQFYGMNPGGYHLTNILFHAANAVLLFILLNRMTGAWGRSLFVAALFAVHPLNVESVAWVAERKNVLSTFCGLLCLLSYLSYRRSPRPDRYLVTLSLFLLGLMAKPMLVTLPFVLLLLDYWPLDRLLPEGTGSKAGKTSVGKLLLEKVPFFLLATASGLMTLYAAGQGGALKSTELFPFAMRAANALASYTEYLGDAALPHNLAVFYPYRPPVSAGHLLAYGLFLGAVTAAVWCAARRRRYLAVGWLWYVGTLVPVIGLVQVGFQSMADRYAYVPLIGIFLIVSWGAYDLFDRIFPRGTRFLFVPAVGAVLAMFMLSHAQIGYWKDGESLFGRALRVTAHNHIAHNGMGLVFLRRGDLDRASYHFREALKIKPDDKEAWNNVGIIFMKQGQFAAAVPAYREVLKIDPSSAKAYNNLGVALACLGRTEEAIRAFRRAISIDPDYEEARNNLRNAREVSTKGIQ